MVTRKNCEDCGQSFCGEDYDELCLSCQEKADEFSENERAKLIAITAERDALKAELATAQKRIAELETVEWVHHFDGWNHREICPWCKGLRDLHAPDCVRRK